MSSPSPLNVVVAGGGVAGLEALLALHALAGDRVRLTLVAPDPEFAYRPLAVAEPFGLGKAYRVPLERFAEATGAELVLEAVEGVEETGDAVRLRDGGSRAFDALVLAPGGRAVAGMEDAGTWWPGGDPEHLGGLLRDVEEGYTKRLAVVVPPGPVWPLPAYELALMTAGEAREMGQDDVEITVVTPERMPLAVFGDEASAATAEELRAAGVAVKTGVVARAEHGGLVCEPGGEHVAVDRILAVPRVVGPGFVGVPADEDGFIRTAADGRVEGFERVWAAGDGIVSSIKFGALATHQARAAAAAIARLAGASDVPDPGEPVLHGRLLVGHRSRPLGGGSEGIAAPLWWPAGKVAGEYLPRWLTEHGVAPPSEEEPPESGIVVRRTLRAVDAETQYLRELVRQFRP